MELLFHTSSDTVVNDVHIKSMCFYADGTIPYIIMDDSIPNIYYVMGHAQPDSMRNQIACATRVILLSLSLTIVWVRSLTYDTSNRSFVPSALVRAVRPD